MKQLKVKKLSETSKLPTRAHQEDVGYDLYSDEDKFIEIGSTVKIKTNIALEIPYGHVGKIEDRSGLASRGLRTGAGVIDPNFRGNIEIVMHNFSNTESMYSKDGQWDRAVMGYRVTAGDRVAQLLIYKVELPEIAVVKELESTSRGVKGFGDSGL